MNVLRNQTFFKPASQSASPAPFSVLPPSDIHLVQDRSSRPQSRLSLSNFRRNSPFSRAPSPTPANLVQDNSYLETLGLKLSEGVTRALAQTTGPVPANELLSGKRPIPPGRGYAFGTMIVLELNAARDNQHLYKAILRLLHKPLSVLLSNLSADLSPLLASSAITAPPSLTSPNPTQIHALAIATFAEELLEKLDELDLRADDFRGIREGLVSLVTKVVNRLVLGLKDELVRLMEALEGPNVSSKTVSGHKPSIIYHPSIAALQVMAPMYTRCLTRYTSFRDAQSILASLLIMLVWKASVALAHRPRSSQSPPSPTLEQPGTKKRTSPTGSPAMTPLPSRFAIKLPPSRPPSPQSIIASTAADACALYELLTQFPRPAGECEETHFAREAVDEAFSRLNEFVTLLQAADAASHKTNPDFFPGQDISSLPLLIGLPVILRTWGRSCNASIAHMVGLSEEEYRKVCLGGFGRAEECEAVVAERVLITLRTDRNVNPAVLAWIEEEIAAK